MKTNGKWIYLFYLDRRLVGCFTSAAHCVALLKQVEISRCIGLPRIVRVKPNFVLDMADVRFEDVSEIIRKAL